MSQIGDDGESPASLPQASTPGLDTPSALPTLRAPSVLLARLGVQSVPTLGTDPALAATVQSGPRSPPPHAPPLANLGRFVVEHELATGGMGRVVEARDPDLRRKVAIKVVLDAERMGQDALSRFVAEAQITAQLQHPNIVPVYEMGITEEAEVYFVMKRVVGEPLSKILSALRSGEPAATARWTRHQLLSLFIQVCNAVAYAHERGVLHRDLKPENIMLGAYGEVLVVDWGIARIMGGPSKPVVREAIEASAVSGTMQGHLIGTPGYMSPEQVDGLELDARSDVWSLGAILFELLVYEPAYPGATMMARLKPVLARSPAPNPRLSRHSRAALVPDEIAQTCMKALAPEPRSRWVSAAELATEVSLFLEGSRRQQEAVARLAEATALWHALQQRRGESEAGRARVEQFRRTIPAWASLEEKAELFAAEDGLRSVEQDQADLFARAVVAGEKALAHDPQNRNVRAFLAQAALSKLQEAEQRREQAEAHYQEARVREYDDGALELLLAGDGALTLRTDPEGAEVWCQRFNPEGLVFTLGEQSLLGTTPLERVRLPMGSYLLVLRAQGMRDTRYPVSITRGRHWDSGPVPVPLFSDSQIGQGFVYVPPGPFVKGGDAKAPNSLPRTEPWVEGFFMAEYPVTAGAYCEFLDALHEKDPEQAWGRVPRTGSGKLGQDGQYWERPGQGGRYRIPEADKDGDAWHGQWPVAWISWDDAKAYAAWKSGPEGQYDLPLEQEWEKAARGVDGRSLPWGERFDAGLCKMRDSRPGRPQPEPVGTFVHDVSVYGVRDLAGSVREWCADTQCDGDPRRRLIKGGSWFYEWRYCLGAYRLAVEPWFVHAIAGIRLVRRACQLSRSRQATENEGHWSV